MNNSEHDPANPESDKDNAGRGGHGTGHEGGGHGGGSHDGDVADGGSHDGDVADGGRHGDDTYGDDTYGDADGGRHGTMDGHAADPGTSGSGGPSAPSEDEVWQDLVARLESTETMPDDLEDTQPSHPQAPLHDDPPQSQHSGQEHLGGPRDYAPAEEDDGFVPEEPPSLAGAEPLMVLAWIGAAGGPLALLLFAFVFRSIPTLAVVAIVAVFVASVVFLVMRLPSERGDDHDDGAVV